MYKSRLRTNHSTKLILAELIDCKCMDNVLVKRCMKKWNISVSKHLQLNGLRLISQTKNFLFLLKIIFFLGWNIKVWGTTRLFSWTAPFSVIYKWSSPIIIRSWLLFEEAALQRYSYKKAFWKYAANLKENTHAKVWFQ